MRTLIENETSSRLNPLDLVEQIVGEHEWPFDRQGQDELTVGVSGRYCEHQMWFSWREELGALSFTCAFDMKVPEAKRGAIFELLALVNEKLWLGHFGLWEDEGVPMFRHTSLLRGSAGFVPEQIEDLMDIAVTECERFYPAFQFVIWGGKSAREAVAASLLETVGEA